MPNEHNNITDLRTALAKGDTPVLDSDLERELAKMPALLVNPYKKTSDIVNESDLRLWAAREMLRDMGAVNGDIQAEGLQAACTAAALLLSWLVSVYFVPYLGLLLLRTRPKVAEGHGHDLYDTPFYSRFKRLVNWCVEPVSYTHLTLPTNYSV